MRLRLLLLVVFAAGTAAVSGGVAAAQPPAAGGEPTIIIRPVERVPESAPVAEPVTVSEPAPVLSPQPDVSEEWVVTPAGRFQALPEDASPTAREAAVGEEHAATAQGVDASEEVHGRHGVAAIFPVVAPEADPVEHDAPAAVAGLKLQAAGGREVAQQSAVTSASKPAKRPNAGDTPRAKARQGRMTVSNPRAATASEAANPEQRPQTRASTTAAQRQAREASARRQAQIRTATSQVKRALRAAAERRRAKIPAPPVIDVPVEKVRGIVVHRRIADRTAALLAAADRANLRLNGWGYRSTRQQIRLRRQHCGSSRYAMYRMPSGRCWPPTAPPGKSMHERGLAIDFYVEGRKGRALPIAGTREFRWLKRNAARYGFHNLPSEAWHWSTNGR